MEVDSFESAPTLLNERLNTLLDSGRALESWPPTISVPLMEQTLDGPSDQVGVGKGYEGSLGAHSPRPQSGPTSDQDVPLHIPRPVDIDPSNDPLAVSSLRTGLCYDARFRWHAIPIDDDAHPEEPQRVYAIYQILCEAGLVSGNGTSTASASKILFPINARLADKAEILMVHTPDHYAFVKRTAGMKPNERMALIEAGDSIYYNDMTFYCSKLSVGGAIESCCAVVQGRVKNAVAVIRPPGHHAVPHEAQGFCIFNNVCVAARVCQKRFPSTCRKILIFDWDVHHGNGTQDTFYEDPNILYISVHVHQNGAFYPRGNNGDHLHCGAGAGVGKNVNIPWTEKGMTDADYMYAFQKVVMPIAAEFDPDLVIVSAGFDAAEGDELGGCHVSPACYAQMTFGMMSLAQGKVVVCLEGGYNLHSISISALAVTRTLMGEPPDRLGHLVASDVAADDVQKVMGRQSRYWACLRCGDLAWTNEGQKGERMHDVIRQYQSVELYKNHTMINLLILRDGVSRSFDNQVLATQNFASAETLILVFHDPPDVLGVSDPRTNQLVLHNTWLHDHLKFYLKWAADAGYGVIDVNVPQFVSQLEDNQGSSEEEEPLSVRLTKELVGYLWENYIEVNSAKKLFVLGVGQAHSAAIHFLNTCDCASTLKGAINFVNHASLHSVRKDMDTFFADWYKRNSLVFVNQNHLIFAPGRKALKRKFGHIIRSPKDGMSDMLAFHQGEVQQWIEARNAAAPAT
ncbi:MAG: Histone deacetylase hda1 [Thelocarpon superellum]|nr:MAG: Histone deacetylase hda1 [Thelocarpon superellum]